MEYIYYIHTNRRRQFIAGENEHKSCDNVNDSYLEWCDAFKYSLKSQNLFYTNLNHYYGNKSNQSQTHKNKQIRIIDFPVVPVSAYYKLDSYIKLGIYPMLYSGTSDSFFLRSLTYMPNHMILYIWIAICSVLKKNGWIYYCVITLDKMMWWNYLMDKMCSKTQMT